MNDAPRYASLEDYVRVLRGQWRLIAVITIVFVGAALALSLNQSKTYQTQASLSFRDPTQDVSLLLGAAIGTQQTPQDLASAASSTLHQGPVLAQVNRTLRRSPSSGSVSSFVAPTTNFLVIQANASNATSAANLANAYARAVQSVNADQFRSHYAAAAATLRRQVKNLPASTDPGTLALDRDRINRLNFVAQTANPAQIVQRAAVPTAPVSTNTLRNTLLGLVVGLTLGIIAAFVRDALDRRLRRSDEITQQLGWPILGHIREEALGRGALAVNGRPTLGKLDFEAFHILRQNLQFINIDDPPRSILVTSAQPEEGKSTVAASLAYASASAGKLTLLVECDLRRPSLAQRLGLRAEPGLVDFLVGGVTPGDIVQSVSMAEGANGGEQVKDALEPAPFACITAGRTSVHPAQLLASERFGTFLRQVSEAYETVVLDTAPVLAVADTLEILPQVDAALVCLRATKTKRNEAHAVKEALERLPNRQVGLVVTGVPERREYEFGYYSYAYGYD